MKLVRMTDELFHALGATKVEWGEPDALGVYTPTVERKHIGELGDDDGETINEHWVPGGTLLLEPRDMYDKALLGAAHQGGVSYAVYSRSKTLEVMRAEMGEEDADEMYDFNTSGSIGIRFPVFMLDDEDPPM